jgi:hypothetical protein
MSLPEVALSGLPVGDHVTHHIEVHKMHNLWHDLGTDVSHVGDTLTRIATGTDIETAVQVRQRHAVLAEQVMTVTHAAAGALTFTVSARHRAVKINAGANIAGLAVTGLDAASTYYNDLHCLLVATANITVDLTSGAIVVGAAPASMTAGQSVPFTIQRWGF